MSKTKRVVAVANEGFAERMPSSQIQYAVALITENEAGWVAGTWYSDLESAQDAADSYNRQTAQVTSEEVLEVQVSSMRAGRVR